MLLPILSGTVTSAHFPLYFVIRSVPSSCFCQIPGADPPTFKESALRRFVFPKHGQDGAIYYAVESNPKTRAMYGRYGIQAKPYDVFIKSLGKVPPEPECIQESLF